MTFDYTQCENLTPQQPNSNLNQLQFSDLPTYNYRLRASESKASYQPPQYAYIDNSASNNDTTAHQCVVKFDVPADMDHTVLFYYKLTNFYQNHRRYVKSLDSDQLKGKYVKPSDLENGDCKPLATVDNKGKSVYPCGLIANSYFNDSFSPLAFLNPSDGASSTYTFSEKGIAWQGEAKKYATTPGYPLDQIVPPPNWAKKFPNNYTNDNPPPDLKNDEHFQNWMRTSGLPTFTKLWGRNDADTLKKGTYAVTVNLSMPHF